jgi:putative FmdB family regulatory protein
MPIYEYSHVKARGATCEKEFEVFQRVSAEPLKKCPVCSKPVKKRLSRFGGGVDKLAPSRLKELGFSRWHKRDKGTYERE